MSATVLVPGGTGGLGVAVTHALSAAGWRVVVPWHSNGALERLGDDSAVVTVRADLSDPDSVAEVVAVASSDADAPLRAVAHLVGGFAMGKRLHETPVEDFESMLQLNLRPLYLTVQGALPHLIEAGGGSIVTVSSKTAFAPFAGASAYVTSKAAVWALTSALAVEYARDGIRANSVLPSMIDTPANRAQQPSADRSSWVSPERIAAVVAFLCSEASAAITGAQVPVPGVAER
ncbi:SDR family oxidoreductase [Rhodococcus sp. ABRD24]|uniref:SDR family oxidoreductase n=1 Tax=Rhodococcus sp. ABRD24 TaxID=2507582 RepID=UPI00103A77D8|nr:SDR family oxidoreductase [Rhodococcus sp. ABRD24]QBJ95626.1 SDR family oxidoreductase [Rhodococcus sp. ABRD24]